ncbi:hypothetical protein IVA95_28470 [Bradyrhizobium sp. 157]|uniref:hypothetical protein n=1 Tax=Bradyrhizobium sp. 157 TaxID=2782631 RepID=UPI001FFBC0F2|nr:hypothetical protein [Bradyrhizobium sp. 157]MCK1641389.1 hypothetical protein [Bradyrhizobium sp. 157]
MAAPEGKLQVAALQSTILPASYGTIAVLQPRAHTLTPRPFSNHDISDTARWRRSVYPATPALPQQHAVDAMIDVQRRSGSSTVMMPALPARTIERCDGGLFSAISAALQA